MTELPLECFWSMGKKGRCRSYYNGRVGTYEDRVDVENGISYYRLVGNVIATYDGRILRLSTAGWHTQLTRDRLSVIVNYGRRELGLRIPPIEPRLRMGSKIYWVIGEKAVAPKQYPLEIDVTEGKILTPLLEVIPTYVIQPSRSKKNNAVIRLKRLPGAHIIINGINYLKLFDRMYKLDGGLWVETEQMP